MFNIETALREKWLYDNQNAAKLPLTAQRITFNVASNYTGRLAGSECDYYSIEPGCHPYRNGIAALLNSIVFSC